MMPGDTLMESKCSHFVPAWTKQVSKETYYRGKRDLLCADF